jgi:NitT/TauT family transport system ATP-binding protein
MNAAVASRSMPGTAFVELEHGSLVYGDGKSATLAVDELDLSIPEGRFVSVVGPSGCGKSTLMKIVTGLVPMTRGTARIGGELVRGPVKIVGMAFQNATLLPWRTTLDNVMLPREIVQPHRSRLRAERVQYRDRARALLATVGLEGFEESLPWQLSGGMQQRASLCRALVHEPRLLMLDEPFGALDAFTREELWVLLHDIWARRRFTVILVTHDLREAAFLSDTVFVMSKRPGRIIARRDIERDGPRRLEDTYTPAFAAILHELREHIGRERSS